MIRIEKSFEREVVVDLVEMRPGQTDGVTTIGFDTDTPHIHYRRMPYGSFGVRIKTPEVTDVVIRLDNVVIVHRRLDPGIHTISRTPQGKLLVFSAPGTRIAPAPAEQSQDQTAIAQAETEPTPDFLAPLPLAPSHGLVIVSARFADVKPVNGPELPPDDFSHVVFQMNEHREHLRALSANMRNMVAPARIPDGGEFVTTDGPKPTTPLPRRTCCCAPDRE